MNKDTFKGNWLQLKGEIKKTWGKLTDDEIHKIDGDMDKLAGAIQEKYGETKEQTRDKLNTFLKKDS